MWGYELPSMRYAGAFLLSYESPCGVMRFSKLWPKNTVLMLRIPMWGYEQHDEMRMAFFAGVTNPHVGL